MFNLRFYLFIFIILSNINNSFLNLDDEPQAVKIECKYPENLISTISQFEFIETVLNEKLILECHYWYVKIVIHIIKL